MTTSPRPWQNDQYIKNSKTKSQFTQPKKMTTAKDLSEQKKERLKSWVTFYRHNLSFFVEHYMGITLFPYQRYWITLMGMCTIFLAIASRASAKSWLIGVYAMAKCILYPGTTVALNSSTKAQAGLIISEKCQELINKYPNVAREVLNIVTNQNKWEVTFHNGSKINVVISGEGGRGHRSNICVLEERRLIPTIIIDSIIRPFLVSRKPEYLKNPEYANAPIEESQEITITSAYYKSHEWWAEAKHLLRMIANGDTDVKAVFLDYLITLKHGIKTKKQMEKEKEKTDPITFLMEYGNIPYSSSNSSYYKVGLFRRNIKRAWRPIKDEDFIAKKKNPYNIPRSMGERRIVSADIAMKKGNLNDNTIISCARLNPTARGWETDFCHIESHNGQNAMLQALRIKQIYNEFTGFDDDAILVLDIQNAGIAVYDALTSVTKDEVRGVEYPAMTVMNHRDLDEKVIQELRERTLAQNAKPCIFPISATAALNSAIAVSFRDRLKRKLINFLVDEIAEEEFLIKSGNKDILDQEDMSMRAYLAQGSVQTSLLILESIALEMVTLNGYLKLVEPNNARKDRFSCASYLNWVVSLMDKQLLKETDGSDDWSVLQSVTFFG